LSTFHQSREGCTSGPTQLAVSVTLPRLRALPSFYSSFRSTLRRFWLWRGTARAARCVSAGIPRTPRRRPTLRSAWTPPVRWPRASCRRHSSLVKLGTPNGTRGSRPRRVWRRVFPARGCVGVTQCVSSSAHSQWGRTGGLVPRLPVPTGSFGVRSVQCHAAPSPRSHYTGTSSRSRAHPLLPSSCAPLTVWGAAAREFRKSRQRTTARRRTLFDVCFPALRPRNNETLA